MTKNYFESKEFISAFHCFRRVGIVPAILEFGLELKKLSASACGVLGLKACTITLSSRLKLLGHTEGSQGGNSTVTWR